MADPTALDIIDQRIAGQITGSTAPGFFLFPNRSDDDPLGPGEFPGVVSRIVDFDFGMMPGEEMSQWLITATMQFDCHSGKVAGETIDPVNRTTIATIIARLFADPTLGGRAVDIAARNASGTEMSGADIGTAILEIAIQFTTPRGDLTRIIGMGGTIFID